MRLRESINQWLGRAPGMSGAAARRFRVVVHRMDAIVPPDGGKHHGEVCPGVWVYHYYDVPATASGGRSRLAVRRLRRLFRPPLTHLTKVRIVAV